jgi:predicted ATPase
MVWRERELGDLRAGLVDARAGRERLFLVSGEPGIGKTRLSAEFASMAQADGMG